MTNKLLLPHIRQYRHNSDKHGDEFVFGYDREGVEQLFEIIFDKAYKEGWNDAIEKAHETLNNVLPPLKLD